MCRSANEAHPSPRSGTCRACRRPWRPRGPTAVVSGVFCTGLRPGRRRQRRRRRRRRWVTPHLGGVSDHHVAVHEDVGHVLLDPGEDGRAHGDVGDEVAAVGVSGSQSVEGSLGPLRIVPNVSTACKPSRPTHPSMTSGGSVLPPKPKRPTHVQPVGAVAQHALALVAEVAEVRLGVVSGGAG